MTGTHPIEKAMRRVGAARARAIGVAAAVGLLASCAVVEQQGTPVLPVETPAAAPKTLGAESPQGAEHKRMIALFGGEYKDPAAERFLNDVLVKLAQASNQPGDPYRVTILNTPIVNAFALPPSNLYVTRGLLALANDGSEAAAVMAHEIAHITAKHAVARAEKERRAALISQAARVIQSRQKGEEVEASAKLSIASFSRQQELEADQIGIKAVAKAGYDPYGAARFLAALDRSSALRASLIGQNASAERPDILATHPSTPERVAQAIAVARQIGAPGIGTAARDPYLDAVDGMMFGDDPSDGAIRGRKFLHPRLGFSFTAPDGFTLENSAQAVLGIKAEGVEALRLDSVRVAATTTLEAYLASGWIDGLLPSTVQPLEVNGMPAAMAEARAGEWNFRLAVIRFSPTEVYRLIFATRSLTDEVDARFRASIDSFRRTAPEEFASLKPLRLTVVTAKDGDTAEALGTRMAVSEHPVETFLLLNGLVKGGALVGGDRYKVVTE
jgi:predicted Zn-dependent protease